MENFRLRLLYVIATDFVEDNFVKMADIQLSNILENFKQEDRDITNFYPIASFIVSSMTSKKNQLLLIGREIKIHRNHRNNYYYHKRNHIYLGKAVCTIMENIADI